MTSPIFHQFYKRFIVQRMDHNSTRWENCDSFADQANAERFVREMVKKNPSIRAGRVFDQIANRPGKEYTADKG